MALAHDLVPKPALPMSLTRAELLKPLDLLPRLQDIVEPGSCLRAPAAAPSLLNTAHGTDAVAWDIVDEWGVQSFPASDPPANW